MVASVFNRFAPIDFTRYIDRLTERFTGREWLFEQIDRWLQKGNEQFYLLTGEPGVGKSAIAAKLIQLRNDIAAYHFCRAGDVETVRPGRVLRSLAAQLGRTLPHYGEALAKTIDPIHLRIEVNINIESLSNSQVTGIYIENLKESDPREELEILLRAPLALLTDLYAEHNEPLPTLKLLLIDSLDEAVTTTGRDNMATLLAALSQAEGLPTWIRFILTARPDLRVLEQFESLRLYKLEELLAQNLEDIERYVQSRVQELIVEPSEFQARLDQAQLSAERLVHEVKDLSKGNFLYTSLLVDGIATGELSLKNLSALPKTLNQVYQRFLRNRCPFRKWSDRYQPILGTLTITQEPVSKEQLVKFTGIDSEQLQNALGVLQQFLDEINDEQGQMFYAIFHQSLREYLVDKKHNHDFWCDPQEEHQRIIEHYYNDAESWDNLDWSSADNYGLLHLSKHLYAQVDIAASKNEQYEEVSKYRQNLYNLICKSLMWAKLARFDSHQFFADDVKLAIDISQAENPPNIVQQFRNSLVYATLGALATNVPPEVIGALVRVGELRKAQGFAALVPDSAKRSRAWLQISEVVMGAVQKAETTKHKAQQMLAEIAKDGLTKALEAAETIQDEAQKAEMLAEVATALARIDYREGLHRVLEAAIAITDEEYRAKSLSEIAKALAQVGDIDALNLAFKAAEKIEQVISKVQALSEVSLAVAQVGDNQKLRQVVSIVEQIERVDYKMVAIRPISLALAKLGDVNSLNRIRKMIDGFKISREEFFEVHKTEDLAEELIQIKQSLNELFEGIQDDHQIFTIFYKVSALASLSLAVAQAGERERAINLIDEALELERKVANSKSTNKALMLGEIGTAVAQIGDQGCLFRLLNEAVKIDDDVPQDIMMSKIGLALAEAGNIEGVCQIIALLRTEFFGIPLQMQYPSDIAVPNDLEYWKKFPRRRRREYRIFDENKKIKRSRHEKLIAEILGKAIETLTYTEFSEQFNQDSRYSGLFNQKPKYSHSGYLGWEVKVVEIVDEEYRPKIFAKQIINWASDFLLKEKENVIELLEKLSPSDQVKAIGKFAPLAVRVVEKQKSSELLYRLLTLAEAIEHPTLRRNALSKLALPFAQIRDQEVLQWLLTAVQVIEAEQSQSETSSLLASNLAKLATQDTLKQAILIAEAVKDENSKRNILLDVFSELKQNENREELALIQTVAETIKRPDYKMEILLNSKLNLAAVLGNENFQNELSQTLTQAINIFDEIEFKHYQERVLNFIIECVVRFRLQVLLPWVLEAVERISNLDDRVKSLDKLIQALAVLKERNGLSQALSLIAKLEDKEYKAKLLGRMAEAMAFVDGDIGFVKILGIAGEEFSGTGETIEHEQRMLDCSCYALFLSKVTPIEKQLGTQNDVAKILKVQKAKTQAALAVIMSWFLETEEECKTAFECIKRVIPSIVQLADEEMWKIAFTVVQQIEREDYRAKILCELATVFVSPIHLQQLNWVINIARTIKEQDCKTELLSTTALSLSTMGDQASLTYALNIVNSIKDNVVIAKILIEITQVLAEAENREGLYQVLEIAQTLRDEQSKTEIISRITRYLSQLGDEAGALSTWNLQLTNAHLNGRSGVFHILSAGIPFISNTDQGQTLWQLYSALNEVESWWIEPKDQKIFPSEPEKASTLIDLGRQYLQQEQWAKALECFEQSLAISRQIGNQQKQALALHHIAQVYLKQEQWTEAIKYLKQDLALCYELNDIRGQAQNLSNLAVAYGGQNLRNEAIECLKQSLSLMHQLGFQEGDRANLYDLAATFHNLGGSYMQLKQWTEAINSFEQALTVYRKLGDAEEIVDTLQILVDLYRKVEQESRGIVGKVTSWFQKIQQGAEQVRISNKAKEAEHLELLADIRHKQGQWAEAIEYYKQCLDILHQLDDQAKKAFILHQMGAVFCDQGDRTEAIQCYEQSLAIAHQTKNPKIEGWSLNNLGSVYNEQQQWTEAERCYRQSLAIARQVGDREMEADILHALGCNYSDQKRWAETIPYFDQDLEIRRELGDCVKEVLVLSNLSQLYSILGNEIQAKALRQEAWIALSKIDPNSPEAKEVEETAKILQAKLNIQHFRGK